MQHIYDYMQSNKNYTTSPKILNIAQNVLPACKMQLSYVDIEINMLTEQFSIESDYF